MIHTLLLADFADHFCGFSTLSTHKSRPFWHIVVFRFLKLLIRLAYYFVRVYYYLTARYLYLDLLAAFLIC